MNSSKRKNPRSWNHFGGTQNFRSYADFKAAFNEYCRKSAAAGRSLTFVRHQSEKLSVNTFHNDKLDQFTINRFVYHHLSLKCIHHEDLSMNDTGPYCRGCIQIRYNRSANVLNVKSFSPHSNDHKIYDVQEANLGGDSRLNRIVEIARQLPDDALALLEQIHKMIHVKQERVCVGSSAAQRDKAVISQNEFKSQSSQSGANK